MRRDLRIFGAAALVSCLIQPAFAADPPAVAIATKMATVTDELNRNVTGKPVQTEQKTIVKDLDELIASLEKKCDDCKGGIKRATTPIRAWPTRPSAGARAGSARS